jgi:hypothetical protein
MTADVIDDAIDACLVLEPMSARSRQRPSSCPDIQEATPPVVEPGAAGVTFLFLRKNARRVKPPAGVPRP